jgi:hypothetical protein
MTLISSFALTIFLFTITTPLSWTPIAIFVLLACKLICFTHAILPQTSPGTILASASPPIDVFLLHEYHKVDPPRQCFPGLSLICHCLDCLCCRMCAILFFTGVPSRHVASPIVGYESQNNVNSVWKRRALSTA